MALEYDYLVKIDGWVGPSFLAGRSIIFQSNIYLPILKTPQQRIIKSADANARSPASIVVSNDFFPSVNKRFTDWFSTQKIEGRALTISEVERPISFFSTPRLVYKGIILYVSFNEMECELVCAEDSLSLSKRLDLPVDTEVFPRAKPEDVGKSIPVPFGNVQEAMLPVIQYNRGARLSEPIDDAALLIEVDNVDGLSLGPSFLGEESIAITAINPITKILTITRTEPTEHPSGDLVFNELPFSLGVDASGLASIIDSPMAVEGDETFALPSPNTQGLIGPVQAATWDATPTYKRAIGEGFQAVGIETEVDAGSSATETLNAAGRSPGYQEKNFASILGVTQNVLQIKTVRWVRPRGKIKKVLISVSHSGNRGSLAIGNAPVSGKPLSSPFFFAGLLSSIDQLDKDFMELAEQKGRRAVDVAVPPKTRTVSLMPDVFVITGGGATNQNFDPTQPQANVHDGSLSSFGRLTTLQPGPGQSEFEFSFSALPSGVAPASILQSVRFKFRHGGSSGGFTELSAQGQTGQITLFRSGVPVAGPGVFPANSVAQVDEQATFAPGADTYAQLLLYKGRIRCGTVATLGQWLCFEGWFEIDVLEPESQEDAGSVTNQFDITPLMPLLDWREFKDFEIQIGGDGTNFFRVYHAGLTVIYSPEELRLPENLICNIQSAIANVLGKQAPADVIYELWTNPTLGANSVASIISPAALAPIVASQLALGYDLTSFAGLIRETELYTIVQEIAKQTRLFVYIINGVLQAEFQELILSLPAPLDTLTKDDILPNPSFVSADIEQQVINFITARYDFTDYKGSKNTLERESLASVTAFGQQRTKLDFSFLKDTVTVDATIAGILDRKAAPYLQGSFSISLQDRNRLAILTRLALSLGWVAVTLFEVEEMSEGFDHTIQVKGRVLID